MTRASRGSGPHRRFRRLAGRVLVVALLSVGVVTVAAPAWAISLPGIGDCKSQPVPQAPGTGVEGFFETKPSPLPAPAQAFGKNPPSTEYDQYGYAGLFWSTYDLGCISNPITDTGPTIDAVVGNWALGTAKTIVALDNSAHTWASDPAWTAALTPLVGGANSALFKALFLVWAGAALMAVGISVALRAHRSDMPAALTLATWALFVLTLVSGVVAAPGWAGQQASALMSSTLNALDAGFAGPGSQPNASEAHASLTVNAILYPAWLRGEFGDPSSAAAQKYGAALFEAQALTWSQAAGSPAQINAIDKADQAKWAQVAADVKSNYPQLYPNLQGTGNSRAATGLLAVLTAVIVCGYDFIASLVVVMALLAVMAGVVMLPALAVVGLHHNMRHIVIGLGSRVFGMLVNGVLWAAGAAIDALVTRSLLTNTLVSPELALLILAVLPFALWMVTRVLRGRPAVPRAVRRAAMLAVGYGLLRGGARAGAREAAADEGAANAAAPPMFYRPPDPWTWRQVPPPPPDPWTWRQVPPPPPPGGGGGGGPRPVPPGGGGPLPSANGGPRPLPPGGGGGGGGPRPLPPGGGGPLPSANGGPRPVPPGGGGPLPSANGGPRPVPPASSSGGGQLPPPASGGLGPGGGQRNALGSPANAPASGPRDYTGPQPPTGPGPGLVPTRLYRPGEPYEDPGGLYDGGHSAIGPGPASASAAPPPAPARPESPFDRWGRSPAAAAGRARPPHPRHNWSAAAQPTTDRTPCGTCRGSGYGGGGHDHGTTCPTCRGWGF